MSDHQAQIELWSGAGGKRWTLHQVALDHALRPFGLQALDALRLSAGEHVLDIGCGCADTTLEIAERVGTTGRVLGVDVSPEMLERATARTFGMTQISFLKADAANHKFSERFDALASRFGVMFFADNAAAFYNLRAALKPAGRLGFVCWRALSLNPWCTVPLAAVQSVLTDAVSTLDAPGPGPFAFSDADYVTSLLETTGFENIRLERFDTDVVFSESGIDAAVEFALSTGPGSRLVLDAPEATRPRIREALADALAPYTNNEVVALRGSTWIVSARVKS
jgi:SAM-dependent methyltransferase